MQRIPWDGERVMEYRIRHLAALPPDNWLSVDTDMLIQHDLGKVFAFPFDVAVTQRDGPIWDTNGNDIVKFMPYNAGVVWWRVWLLVKIQHLKKEPGMASWAYAALRTGAQALWGWLVVRAAAAGITLPDWAQNWFVETVIVAGGIALITAAIRWLETRKGNTWWENGARWLAKIVMLGLSGKQPVYAAPQLGASPTTVVYDSTQTSRALRE